MISLRSSLKKKNKLILFFLSLAFSFVLVVNSIAVNSPFLGTIASLGFLSVVSFIIGGILYSTENLFFRILFGFAAVLIILSLSGIGLMLVGSFTVIFSSVIVAVIGVAFGAISLKRKNQLQNLPESPSVNKTEKRKYLNSFLMIAVFLSYSAVAFRLLLLARTDEGGSSVWLEISPLFVPIFALATLFLSIIFFFSPIGDGLKLVLLCVYTFLAHSLFLFVWYPSRYGDPLALLGQARYTATTGTIYAYGWMLSHLLIEGIVAYQAQFSLTIFFERMFSVDIYWVHVVLVPLLWSIFVPSLAYKIAKLVTVKKSRVFPLLTALATGLFASLVLWGTVSVPNSLSFIFFFLSVVFLIEWMKSGGRWNWFMSILAVGVVFWAHPQPGIFALMLFLWVSILRSSLRKVFKIVSLLLTLAIYPLALYLNGASFSSSGLLILENFLSFQSEIITILLLFGLFGLVLGVKQKYVNVKIVLVLFAFYVAILFEYYFSKFGMTNLPFGAQRILVMGDFLLAPFVALGMLATLDMLGKAFAKSEENVSFGLASRKLKFNVSSRLIALSLICLFVSAQATVTLYQTYPHKEAVDYQPSAYMIDAVQFIDADASGRYVVLCDTTISAVAIGFLGIDYGWAGGHRGVFGMPEWTYPSVAMYWNMTKKPSLSIVEKAISFFNATIGYFVVWVGHPNFEEIVRQTSVILPVYKQFGDGKLFVFKYPVPVTEEQGPAVKVAFDNGASDAYVETRLAYFFEVDINTTLTLSGHISYNISEYPMHWVFLDLLVNDVPGKFDESSDINSFLYVSGLQPNDVLKVKWHWNSMYPSAVWKEDSFQKGWRIHDLYKGSITPEIVSDGNILNISYTFASGPYSYYYYVKDVDIPAKENQFIMVRWRCDGPIAGVAYYFELGLGSGVDVVPLGSESFDWTVTIVKLPKDVRVTYLMVGLSNLRARNISGLKTLSVDYILISTSA